ncbi:hypothetical protein HYH03_018361 [Edaphochlamys debaryana]|uniref:EML-like first beta-propeller domain-containing protein n=1 Tax=Edaphochlamys debaryana TaxID=47281 RepID=A0A835XG58_9CHLO|nr:hypothetical protein HYH03_018361 [Edaphochlamys debaryana]|eukprot:KAG2482730.1 hypothetical protein HYH03_018361 [Edaphochlamys debaryana]
MDEEDLAEQAPSGDAVAATGGGPEAEGAQSSPLAEADGSHPGLEGTAAEPSGQEAEPAAEDLSTGPAAMEPGDAAVEGEATGTGATAETQAIEPLADAETAEPGSAAEAAGAGEETEAAGAGSSTQPANPDVPGEAAEPSVETDTAEPSAAAEAGEETEAAEPGSSTQPVEPDAATEAIEQGVEAEAEGPSAATEPAEAGVEPEAAEPGTETGRPPSAAPQPSVSPPAEGTEAELAEPGAAAEAAEAGPATEPDGPSEVTEAAEPGAVTERPASAVSQPSSSQVGATAPVSLPPEGTQAEHRAEAAAAELADAAAIAVESAERASSSGPGLVPVAPPRQAAPLDGRAPLLAVLGLDTHRHHNALLIDEDTLVSAIGSHVVLLSLSTGQRRYLRGLDGGGVGAVAVHPSRTLLAVGEKARSGEGPCVYIYSYPALECVKVLSGGTERAYSALAFDAKGDTLASVGSFPDFLLTLWDWKQEAIVLRAKAFSQDVYTVAFSPYFEGQLTTSGQGHIRFWRMASTFTGLKLQGAIGKFGNTELSDVAAFVELPDGKVLSSTEGGELLLWDGGLIKVVLTRPGGQPCHDGPVEVLLHDRAASMLLSAGGDGYVRIWDYNAVNDAEPGEEGPSVALTPVDEVPVAPGQHLVALLREGKRWVVLDRAGGVTIMQLPAAGPISRGATFQRLSPQPAGAVAGLALSPASHVGLAAGKDGHLRVIDYRSGATLASAPSSQPITAFAPLPPSGSGPAALACASGHKDGVVRVHCRCTEAEGGEAGQGLALLGAAKAHAGPVAALAVSKDAKQLASCGEDGTVFFFDLQPPAGTGEALAAGSCGLLAPRAFVRLPNGCGAASCAVWDAEGAAVLVGTVKGTILQVPVAPSGLDTGHSYEWAAGTAEVKTYAFCAPKPPKPKKKKKGKKEGEEGDQADGEAPDGDEAAPQEDGDQAVEGEEKSGEDGEGGEGREGDEGEEEKEEEETDAATADGLAASSGELLTLALAADDPRPGALIVSVGGSGYPARKVWRVWLDEPVAAPLLEGFPSAPVTSFGYSPNGTTALMGSADGLVRLQALDGPYGSPLGPCWEAPLHDMQTGRVSSVALSWDGSLLLTAAHDGAVHLLSVQMHGPTEPRDSGPEELPARAALPPSPADVTSPSAYTLEEEKQQAERDQQVREAEEKKLSVRERLARIRAEFESLLAENEAQPEPLRLARGELEVDPGLRAIMEAEAKRREEVARLELAWESERQRLGLAKLRRYFLDSVETERVVLYSLRGGSAVTTFRTARLPDELKSELAHVRAAQAAAAAHAAATGDGSGRDTATGDGRKNSETGGPSGDAAARARLAEATAALEEGTASGRLNKADLRRLARKRREAEWAAFNATRPDDTYDSPADIKAIEEAQRTIGDFKLKSDPNFVVPEEERMTPARKRAAMLELEEALHATRAAFNAKFFALRDVKKKVLVDVRAKLAALQDLATLAGSAASAGADAEATAAAYLAPFSGLPSGLLPEEQPAEARETVTDEDLLGFAARKQENERKAAAVAAGGLGGFAAGGGGAAPAAAKKPAGGAAPGAAPPGAAPAAPGAPAAGAAAGAPGASGLSAAEEALAKMMAAVPPSDLEKGLAAYNRRRVEHMRTKLTDEINAMLEAFDDAHSALKAEKLALEADVRSGEMRLLVCLQELQLLREFDKRESVLLQKRQAKLDDKQEIVDKITDCSDKLEQKRSELEGLIARRAAVVAELDAVVPETDPFREALVRVFHRRIKRSKKKAGGGDDDYDSDEEEEDEDMGDDEGDDDDDGGEEVCPPGCDQSVYERVCDLREKRLDEEDMIAEFQKTIEVLRKEKEALAKKQRLVEQGLAAVNADMAEFQKEKQGRLNQVEVVVALKMHQVEYLLDGCLPDDLSAALVFSSAQLRRLQRRVEELEEEKSALRAAHKDLKREQAALLKDKSDKEKKVAELEARAHDVQMLKFGQVIDLELLDKVSSSRGTEELKEELRKQEVQYTRELAEWDARISARMDELVVLTRENTACLNAVSELTAAQRRLESGLTATRKGLFSDPVQQRKAEVEERDALVQLVNAQAQELDRLKTQLMALRRKDTSVFG